MRTHCALVPPKLNFQKVTSLRSELHAVNAQLVTAQSDLENYKESLTAAENNLERVKREAAANLAVARPSSEELIGGGGRAKSGTPIGNVKVESPAPAVCLVSLLFWRKPKLRGAELTWIHILIDEWSEDGGRQG